MVMQLHFLPFPLFLQGTKLCNLHSDLRKAAIRNTAFSLPETHPKKFHATCQTSRKSLFSGLNQRCSTKIDHILSFPIGGKWAEKLGSSVEMGFSKSRLLVYQMSVRWLNDVNKIHRHHIQIKLKNEMQTLGLEICRGTSTLECNFK
jgi:hypothetical protein